MHDVLEGLWIAACSLVLFHVLFVLLQGYVLLRLAPMSVLNTHIQKATLIIAAKNEAKNLQQNLELWLAQSRVELEVIVVLDDTTDHSMAVLSTFKDRVTVLRSSGGKKRALEQGIFHASNPFLIFTDADCAPASSHWAANMIHPLSTGYDAAVGYGRYAVNHTLLGRVIQYGTLVSGADYLASTVIQRPYMAVGRSFAYRKSAFDTVQGFCGTQHLAGGDDDLLLQKFAKAGLPVKAVSELSAQTVSKPKETWTDWLKQKTRHQSAGKLYSLPTVLYLWAMGCSRGLLWILLPYVWVHNGFSASTSYGICVGLAYCMMLVLWSRRLHEAYSVWYTPLFEIILLSGTMLASIRSFFTNQSEWN